jgi:hypothetical protein
VTPLTDGRYDDDHPAFAPDGDALAFAPMAAAWIPAES